MSEDRNFQIKLLLLLKDLKRMQAIKEYRLFYRTSLKEARGAVDELMKKTSLWDIYWMDEEDTLSEEELEERVDDG